MNLLTHKFTASVVAVKECSTGYGKERKTWIASQLKFQAADETYDTLWIPGQFKIGESFTVCIPVDIQPIGLETE